MSDWKEQSMRVWQNMDNKRRYIIIGSAVFLFLAVLGWSYWWGSQPDLVPLFTNMDAKDAGEVREKLKEMKVYHEIGGNGTAILVPAKDVYQIRLDLASQGLPRGNKGFEIFDQNKFGTTEFQNKVYLVQALQGELTRTIEQMSEVEKARVHIVLPEDSLYKNNEKPATASIMLKLRPGAQLSREQVRGIVNLVAHSIQGLKPENITVVDSFAKVLNEQSDPGMAGAGTVTQIEMTKKVQDDLQKNVQSLLEQVLGAGKSAVRVNVELSFDQRTVDRQIFDPVVDDKGIIRSSQEQNENYKGNSPAAGGPPGTASNIPGYVSGGNTQSNYEKKEVTRNYEINETKEKVVAAPGAIKRLTVAVLVDANIGRAEQDSIIKTVSSAIGLNPARGDVISVESLAFSTEMADKQRQEERDYERQQNISLGMKIGAAILAIIAIILIARYIVRRRQTAEDMEAAAMSPDLEPENVLAAEMEEPKDKPKELTPEEKELQENKQAIENLAKNKPDDLAQLIRAWLADE